MSLVRDFVYKGTHFKISVNQNGSEYLAVIDIAGVTVPPAAAQITSSSEEGAFDVAERHAHELIDRAPGHT